MWRLSPTVHRYTLGPLNGKLHILARLVIHFIRVYIQITISDNVNLSFLASVAISNKQSYLRSNILYIKWKYDADITKIDMHECTQKLSTQCKDSVIDIHVKRRN